MSFDHVLIIGFGGPRNAEEVAPFLKKVTEGRNIPPARLREVADHYERIGGFSPYNEEVFQFQKEMEARLAWEGIDLPLFVGMRCWHPFLDETIQEIKDSGLTRGIGFILTPHRSEASYGRYVKSVEEAKWKHAAQYIHYEYVEPWHEHPAFVRALAKNTERVLSEISGEPLRNILVIFTAHSIPSSMAGESGYREQFETTSRKVAESLGIHEWRAGYQSRSGHPQDPWLEPDVKEILEEAQKSGKKRILVVPVGFVCDNAEVLYDLDIKIKEEAEKLNLEYYRAPTAVKDPAFAQLGLSLIRQKMNLVV